MSQQQDDDPKVYLQIILYIAAVLALMVITGSLWKRDNGESPEGTLITLAVIVGLLAWGGIKAAGRRRP